MANTFSSYIFTAYAFEGKEITNFIGMKFILIPSGSFKMGRSLKDQELKKIFSNYEDQRIGDLTDEIPVHTVKISKQFYLGKFEVTKGQFRKFIELSGYVPESISDGTGAYGYSKKFSQSRTRNGDVFEGRNPKYSWLNPGFYQRDDEPVVNITWNDAVAMTTWLSHEESKIYRLPTEAEWEYSCKAQSNTAYYFGNNPKELHKYANTFDNTTAKLWPQWSRFSDHNEDGYIFTSPIGKFSPNNFDLFDMIGNVWEWTSDWYSEDYYKNSPSQNPQGPSAGNVKVRRGGSWHTWPLYSRCTYRNWNNRSTRYTLVGFRILLEDQ